MEEYGMSPKHAVLYILIEKIWGRTLDTLSRDLILWMNSHHSAQMKQHLNYREKSYKREKYNYTFESRDNNNY